MVINDYLNILFDILSAPALREQDYQFLYYDLLRAASVRGGQDGYNVIYNLNKYIDVDNTPEQFLPWLATFVNFPLNYFAHLFNWEISKQRTILKWLFSNQRYTGSNQAIKEFVEEFITDCVVNEIYEPWKDVFMLSKSELSGKDRFQGQNYYRDSVVNVHVSNSDNRIIELLEWLIDPHVLLYVDIDQCITQNIHWDAAGSSNITIFIDEMSGYDSIFKLSDSKLSGISLLDGKGWAWLNWVNQLVNSSQLDSQWWPLVSIIFTPDMLSKQNIISQEQLELTNKLTDILSGDHSLDGTYYIDLRSPTFGERIDWAGSTQIEIQEV